MEPRNSFVFYRSFYEAITMLRPKDRADVILAICEYALNGKEPALSGVPAALFLLVKPNLDANQRKYENGKKKGKSKLQANAQQTGSKPEPDADEDADQDGNADGGRRREDVPPSATAAAVEAAYREKINPLPSQTCLDELAQFADEMGQGCCLRAIDAALDAGKPSWAYIRAILRAKRSKGVRSLADWDALEARRQQSAPASGGGRKSWVEVVEEMEREEGLA